MKSFKLLLVPFLLWTAVIIAQEESRSPYSLEANYFYGSFLKHNRNVAHLVTAHPEGFTLSYSKPTKGEEYWESLYNYPDVGASLIYYKYGDSRIGDVIAGFGHFNFYFLNRALRLRVAQGIGVATNPFDIDTNPKNIVYGSRLLTCTYFQLNYGVDVSPQWKMQTGLQFMHFSNGSLRSPNLGTNTIAFNLGIQYDAGSRKRDLDVLSKISVPEFNRKLQLEVVLSGGVNESDFIGLGAKPFFGATLLASKRFSYSSTWQFGADFFYSNALKSEIEFVSIAFPNRVKPGTDFKRVGVFTGYQLRLNKLAVLGQVGYYVYSPYDELGNIYQRIGVRYDMLSRWYIQAALRTHFAKAEAIEFGLGFKI